eukprot:gene29224-12948_t
MSIGLSGGQGSRQLVDAGLAAGNLAVEFTDLVEQIVDSTLFVGAINNLLYQVSELHSKIARHEVRIDELTAALATAQAATDISP